MSYVINGMAVGQDPSNFDRDLAYKTNSLKIGNSKDNIKTIKNFISKEECEKILSLVKDSEVIDTGKNPQWDGKTYGSSEIEIKLFPTISKITKLIQEQYQVPLEVVGHGVVVKWIEGEKMSAHVDDLGIENYHMSSILYLNDDYEGGEISFITQGVSIKPGTGDLVMFPGNLHYAHEVKEILSGSRFTMPVWYKHKQ